MPDSFVGAAHPVSSVVETTDLDRARAGDQRAFARLVEPLRRELRAHCYRMLGSVADADDALQEAMIRAWRGLPGFEGRSAVRSWMYAIATRTCIDASTARARRALPIDLGLASEHVVLDGAPSTDVRWLTPYPDSDPCDRALRRESLELAFVAALQHLPGNQRAALLLFDVLGFTAAQIAEMMKTTVASVNSALSRARRVLPRRITDASPSRSASSSDDRMRRSAAARFADTLVNGDVDAFMSLLMADVTWEMPPLPQWYRGRDAVVEFAREVPMKRCPSWKYELISANGQPAIAFYVGAGGPAPHEAWSLTVLDVTDAGIAGIVSFLDPTLFPRFGLPTLWKESAADGSDSG